MNNIVGNNIRTLRENAGFTQTNLATFLGVDQSMISKIEKGERIFSVSMIEKLATLFGVNVEQLESYPITASKLSFAFRGNDVTASEMEVISAINKIALNLEFMRNILEEQIND